MTLALQSPEDVINASLARIGYKRRIGSIYDGSEASKIALDLYSQTRDALLREEDWGFAERISAGVISGSAPPPWSFQYAYPADCLKVKAIIGAAYASDHNNPTPVNWRVGNAVISGNAVQVIWANLSSMTLVYTGQITNPTTWEPLFAEALVAALARRFTAGLGTPEMQKMEVQDEASETQLADSREG